MITNFYPFEETLKKTKKHSKIIEKIDIGGPSMIRAAAKNYNDVTVITYIGELFRYLVATKKSEYETKHKIRGIYGNGLRPEVWKIVQERFGIDRIVEFYGASEGNISLTNVDSKFGSIGRIPPYLKSVLPTKVVKFDVENEVVIRDENGFCICLL